MSLEEEEDDLLNIKLSRFLTESISRFDSIYAANSASFIRFELIKRVVKEFVVLAVGIRSAGAIDDGENGLILRKSYFQISQLNSKLTPYRVLLVVAKDSKINK
jgi:hypothetical protein